MAAPYEILDEEELGRKDAKPPAPLQHRQQVRADIIAGSLAALMVLVFNVITAGVVFSPGDQLEDSMSDGVVLTLLATCSTTLVLLLCSQLPMVTGGDVFLAAMYGHHIKGALLDVDEPFATLVVAMSVCSLLLGIMCWVMGTLQAGKLVQFLPTPVMTGYLAAIGYVMLDSAAVMAAGCSLLEPECLLDSPDAPQLGLALVAGALLYVAQKLTSGLVQTVLSPAVLVALTLGFTVLRAAWGDEALSPWAMHVDASPASLWRALAPVAALDSAAWRAALRAAAATASVVALPMAVGRLLGISAVQSRYDVDVEFNRELRMNSLMYVASAATGGLAIGPSIASSLLMSEMGGRTKLAPAVALLVFALATCSVGVVRLVPKVGFALMMANSGLAVVFDNLQRAWSALSPFEFAMVLLHVVLTATVDMMAAVVLGLLFTAVSFIVEYSRHSGVLQRATIQLERSKVLRAAAEHAAIDEHGTSVFIVHLHGMIFFGSAYSVVEAVREHTRYLSEAGLPRLRCLLLDFDRCSAIDSSAASVLFQCCRRADLGPGGLVFACASPSVLPMLQRADAHAVPFEHFSTLDLALEHCENLVLAGSARYNGTAAAAAARPGATPADADAAPVGEQSRLRMHIRKSVSDLAGVRVLYAPPSEPQRPGRVSPPRASPFDALPDFSSSLPKSRADYRLQYLAWRTGEARGARGEPLDATATTVRATADGCAAGPDATSSPVRIERRPSLPVSLYAGVLASAAAPPPPNNLELEKARRRFVTARERGGGRGDADSEALAELVSHMELVGVPPNYLLYGGAGEGGGGGGEHEDSLLVVDSGFVTIHLAMAGSSGGDAEAAGSAAAGGAQHRLAKVGPGHLLNVGNFVGRRLPRGTEQASTDTFCQLLRLSRARFELLERRQPALACELYRLLVQTQQEAVEDYRIAEATSSAFQVAVKPSASLLQLLSASAAGAAGVPGAVEAPAPAAGGRAPGAATERPARVLLHKGGRTPRQLQSLAQFQLQLARRRAPGPVPASRSVDSLRGGLTASAPVLPTAAGATTPTAPSLAAEASSDDGTAVPGSSPDRGRVIPRNWSTGRLPSRAVSQSAHDRLPSIPMSPKAAAAPGIAIEGVDKVLGTNFVLTGIDSDSD